MRGDEVFGGRGKGEGKGVCLLTHCRMAVPLM